MSAEDGTITWISVEERLPDTRRRVLVYGVPLTLFKSKEIVAITKFNPSKTGGNFDLSSPKGLWYGGFHVLLWAEINLP